MKFINRGTKSKDLKGFLFSFFRKIYKSKMTLWCIGGRKWRENLDLQIFVSLYMIAGIVLIGRYVFI